jgi:hypothetical protein
MLSEFRFVTNLDVGKGKTWPTVLPWCPNKGDYIEAADGTALKVVAITYAEKAGRCIVTLELNK